MLDMLKNLDRRWIFLLMLLAVAVPVLVGLRFPEEPSPMVRNVFAAIDDLPERSRILMAGSCIVCVNVSRRRQEGGSTCHGPPARAQPPTLY